MLCDILLRPQHTDHVNSGIIALEIHHGDVEIDPNLRIRIGIQCQIGFELGGEEGFGLEYKKDGHGSDCNGGKDGPAACTLEEVHGDLAVHVQVGNEGAASHGCCCAV